MKPEDLLKALLESGKTLDTAALTKAVARAATGRANTDRLVAALKGATDSSAQGAEAVVKAIEELRKDMAAQAEQAMNTELVLEPVYVGGELKNARIYRRKVSHGG